MDWVLCEQEHLQSRVRRYHEYPFFPEVLEPPILQPLQYPKILHDNDVKLDAAIKDRYITRAASSSASIAARRRRTTAPPPPATSTLYRPYHDASTLAKFVAESKFQADPEKFVALICAGGRGGDRCRHHGR
jgi:chorismate mutase